MKLIIKNKTFEDIIDENSCRYPLGNLLDSYKYFCGHERYGNLPYCKVHFELCEHIDPKKKGLIKEIKKIDKQIKNLDIGDKN